MAQAKHKAPTQVALVQEERSQMAQWVERNWRLGAVLAIAITAIILGRQYMGQKGQEGREALWAGLEQAQSSGDPDELVALADELPGTEVEAWALLHAAQGRAFRREYAGAREALGRLEGVDSPLIQEVAWPLGEDGEGRTVLENLRRTLASQEAQDEALADRFTNPAPPDGSPQVSMEIDIQGSRKSVVLGLYPDRAPAHVENFLKLVDEGFYDGIKFHWVVDGYEIVAGDPNTTDGTKGVETWGQGGVGGPVGMEKNDLVHAPYVLGAARHRQLLMEAPSSLFLITLRARYDLDGDYTVFGTVLEGSELADEIGRVEIRDPGPTGARMVPAEPVPFIVEAKRIEG